MKQHSAGFSYVCHQPTELSFEGEGFPSLCCKLPVCREVLWSRQDGLGGDGSVLHF